MTADNILVKKYNHLIKVKKHAHIYNLYLNVRSRDGAFVRSGVIQFALASFNADQYWR